MFALYDTGSGQSSKRRRRQWTPATIAVSVIAHGAVLAGFAALATQAEAKPVREEVIAEWNLADKPKPPPPPPPPPKIELPPEPKVPLKADVAPKPDPEPPAPVVHHTPAPPVKGDFVTPRPPEHPPVGIPAPDPNATPITPADLSGVGKEGDVVGKPDPSDNRAPTGNTRPEPPAPPAPPAEEKPAPPSDEPMSEDAVEVRPSLRNESEVQRTLERDYPSELRDSGVTGETVLQFVIDEDGHVDPGSIEVVSSSDDAFAAAAKRVAASMRFSPAKAGGRAVKVVTTMPVHWTIAK